MRPGWRANFNPTTCHSPLAYEDNNFWHVLGLTSFFNISFEGQETEDPSLEVSQDER